MKKIRIPWKFGIIVISTAVLVSALSGCGEGEKSSESRSETVAEQPAPPPPTETVTETEDLGPVESPDLDEAIITYSSGGVFILEDEEWWEVEIGETLTREDSIKTEASSYCEVQFGETAVVRIQENTEITIGNLSLKVGEAQIGLEMKQGSILCKVQKLAGSERVKLQTQTAVCGVRGTEFVVTSEREGRTTLAVKEGSVSVLPATVDVDRLKTRAGDKGSAVAKLLDEIELSAPVVLADQEIEVSGSFLEETESSAREIETIVDGIAEAETGADIDTEVANLEKAVRKTAVEVSRRIEQPKQASEESRKSFEEIEKVRLLPISADTARETESLIPVALNVEPRNAVIELDGEQVATGRFSGIFQEETVLAFRMTAPGYREHSLRVVASADAAKRYTIKLGVLDTPEEEVEAEKAEEAERGDDEAAAVSAEEDAEPVVEEPETAEEAPEPPEAPVMRTVSIETLPRDAVISVDGTEAGTGRFIEEYEEGTRLQIRVERRGYEPRSFTLEVGPGEGEHTVRLDPRVVQTDVRVTDAPLVGRLAAGAGRIYMVDRAGRLIATNLDGDVQWRIETANAPNENSYPVLIEEMVYFSGSKELVIAEAATGEISERIPLEGASAHLFGRRVVPYRGDILFPTNGSIQIRDGRTGGIKHEVEIPNGSRMTPAVWGQTIVIANQQGALLMLDPYSDTPILGNVPTRAVQPVALSVTVWADRAFFSGRRGTVVCVDLADQEVLWERKLPEGTSVFTDIACNGRGLYAFSKGTLYALSVEDGSDLFPPLLDATSPAECGGNRFYYGVGNALAVVNAGTGNELRRIRVPGMVVTAPVTEGSKVIAGTENGRLLVINP